MVLARWTTIHVPPADWPGRRRVLGCQRGRLGCPAARGGSSRLVRVVGRRRPNRRRPTRERLAARHRSCGSPTEPSSRSPSPRRSTTHSGGRATTSSCSRLRAIRRSSRTSSSTPTEPARSASRACRPMPSTIHNFRPMGPTRLRDLGTGQGLQGRIHLLDIDNGVDRELMFEGSAGTNELDPQFSPDGKSLLFERYITDPPDGELSARHCTCGRGSCHPDRAYTSNRNGWGHHRVLTRWNAGPRDLQR